MLGVRVREPALSGLGASGVVGHAPGCAAHVVTDLVLDAVLADDATHVVAGLPGVDGLGPAGAGAGRAPDRPAPTASGSRCPAPGDPVGLGGPARLQRGRARGRRGRASRGGASGWCRGGSARRSSGRRTPRGRGSCSDVGEADRGAAARAPAGGHGALADLDVARWRPEVADALMNLHHRPAPGAAARDAGALRRARRPGAPGAGDRRPRARGRRRRAQRRRVGVRRAALQPLGAPRAAAWSRRARPRSGPSEDALTRQAGAGRPQRAAERARSRVDLHLTRPPQVCCQTPSALPPGRLKWKRRPPGKSNGSSCDRAARRLHRGDGRRGRRCRGSPAGARGRPGAPAVEAAASRRRRRVDWMPE